MCPDERAVSGIPRTSRDASLASSLDTSALVVKPGIDAGSSFAGMLKGIQNSTTVAYSIPVVSQRSTPWPTAPMAGTGLGSRQRLWEQGPRSAPHGTQAPAPSSQTPARRATEGPPHARVCGLALAPLAPRGQWGVPSARRRRSGSAFAATLREARRSSRLCGSRLRALEHLHHVGSALRDVVERGGDDVASVLPGGKQPGGLVAQLPGVGFGPRSPPACPVASARLAAVALRDEPMRSADLRPG